MRFVFVLLVCLPESVQMQLIVLQRAVFTTNSVDPRLVVVGEKCVAFVKGLNASQGATVYSRRSEHKEH